MSQIARLVLVEEGKSIGGIWALAEGAEPEIAYNGRVVAKSQSADDMAVAD